MLFGQDGYSSIQTKARFAECIRGLVVKVDVAGNLCIEHRTTDTGKALTRSRYFGAQFV